MELIDAALPGGQDLDRGSAHIDDQHVLDRRALATHFDLVAPSRSAAIVDFTFTALSSPV
jgi:hypothetical protein